MIKTKGKTKYTEVHAVVTRADGTVEDLGMVCKMKTPSPLKRFIKSITLIGKKKEV